MLIYFRLQQASISPLFSDNVVTSPGKLRDLGNMGLAVAISLLWRIRTEIYVLSYLLPLTGCHLRLIGQSMPPKWAYRVARLRKHGYCQWNVVVIVRAYAELHVLTFSEPRC